MTVQTLLRLAWRESRTARRRLALYMSSIAFGVAALVAIDSFAGNVTRSIRDQSRTLLGGDLSLQARAKFPAVIDTLTDSLRTAGVPASRVTTFASMALAEPSGGTRLVQVRAVSPGYPFYGAIETVPANGWSRVHDDTLVFVDASLLIALDAKVGDRLKLGQQPFTIGGTLGNVPGDAGITAVIGPRVYVSDRWLPQMGLLSFGSRAEYELVLKLPAAQATPKPAAQVARALRRRIDPVDAARIEAAEARGERERNAPGGEGEAGARDTASAAADSAAAAPTATTAPRTRVRVRTVADTEREFTEAVARLADFLSIIGLIALLLGGIGVASGVNAFVSAKIDTVAVLRCLGATSRQVLALYVVQAAAMGLVGAIAGAALGVAVQFLLPQVMGDFLPVDVTIALEPRPLLLGLATGVWVSLVFALRPLLALRRVSPLQAIRRNADPAALPSEWKDGARLLVDALLVGSIVAIVLSRVESLRDGLAMTGGIVAVVLILWLAATALIALARRSTHPSWPFPLRQGIANLHRPANQTRAVTLALGFGAFLLSTVYLVQANLLGRLQTTADAAAGNLLLFDVQDDQAAPLDSMLRVRQHPIVQQTPIVTMRVEAINGTSVTKLQGDSTVRRAGWSLRREYRSTYRHDMQPSEKLVSGTWFPDSAALATQRAADPSRPFLLSLEQDVAGEMGVTLGDTITWNVQGVPVTTVLTNTRSVNWGRFEANFFAVFEPAALRRAPQQYVIVANVPTGAPLAEIQRDIVRRYPNVSSLDLTLVKQTIGAIVDRVTLAIRFLGLFSLAMGIPVLFSAVAATRRARLREGVLLRTLGASRTQVARVLLAEYGALGALGALTGMVLSFGGAWAITTFVFEDPFDPAVGPTLLIAGGMLLLTMTIGLLTSRDVYRETPMIAIREPG
ncbi:MAG: FtsX-like permease family protein [Gemmatimonas sp.]|jgi:putative ABC transport system permease protein|uniref:ABC transporter permease n=1 Tax=Gemmatimonas sp. TaxID=1962908 RepID=UPI0025C06BB1|nr:FtsX-like permease family protein [Gemmatimonas sp.]MCA2988485.1 FtsX-like permease family protein [Gemmatimonas sp.]